MGHGLTYKDTIEHFTKHMNFTAEELEWIMGKGICECLDWPIQSKARRSATAHQGKRQLEAVKRSIDGGEALLEAFRASGADYIFCCSGSEWAPVWEAVARRRIDGEPGPQVPRPLARDRGGGMATGYTLVTQRRSSRAAARRRGLLQGSCAIQGALLANAPMVVFSSESITYGERPGQDPGSQWYRNLSIVGGPHHLVAGVFKWANQAPTIETFFEMVLRAGELARARTRPARAI